MARGNHEVDLEHLLLALLEQGNCDLHCILRRCAISPAGGERELNRPRSTASRPAMAARRFFGPSPQALRAGLADRLARRPAAAHPLGPSAAGPAHGARSGPTRLAGPGCCRLAGGRTGITSTASPPAPQKPCGRRSAQGRAATRPLLAAAQPQNAPRPSTSSHHLLTQRARDGQLDPVIGRDSEIRQLIDILLRRRQNNPILTGEAGSARPPWSKAWPCASPPATCRNRWLRSSSRARPGPAAGRREREGRVREPPENVIDEVRQSPRPIILFIDEAHTLIGAGGQSGQNDAANLLKPALARGELRTIAATTWAEYKSISRRTPPLARRFQVVKVEEPSEALAAAMLPRHGALMEAHFGIRILDEAVTEAVRLSSRYISGRQLPDKAVGVLDTACARVALGQRATPAQVDETAKRILRDRAELAALEREAASGAGTTPGSPNCGPDRRAERRSRNPRRPGLTPRRAGQPHSRGAANGGGRRRAGRPKIQGAAPQAPRPARPPASSTRPSPACASSRAMRPWCRCRSTATWSPRSSPPGRASRWARWSRTRSAPCSASSPAAGAGDRPGSRLEGHRPAGAHGPRQPRRPRQAEGRLPVCRPVGVRKTETALALADILYGGERKLVTINMSEYQEAHSVSGLKVAAGLRGLRRRRVCLPRRSAATLQRGALDEVEKAHPTCSSCSSRFSTRACSTTPRAARSTSQHADHPLPATSAPARSCRLASIGRQQNCPPPVPLPRHCAQCCSRPSSRPSSAACRWCLYPISDEVLVRIIELKLGRIRDRIAANHKAGFSWDDWLVEAVLARCTEVIPAPAM